MLFLYEQEADAIVRLTAVVDFRLVDLDPCIHALLILVGEDVGPADVEVVAEAGVVVDLHRTPHYLVQIRHPADTIDSASLIFLLPYSRGRAEADSTEQTSVIIVVVKTFTESSISVGD